MHPDHAASQAATLREWAEQWERDALAGASGGYGEVAFLMRRAAAASEAAAAGASLPEPEILPAPPEAAEVREG